MGLERIQRRLSGACIARFRFSIRAASTHAVSLPYPSRYLSELSSVTATDHLIHQSQSSPSLFIRHPLILIRRLFIPARPVIPDSPLIGRDAPPAPASAPPPLAGRTVGVPLTLVPVAACGSLRCVARLCRLPVVANFACTRLLLVILLRTVFRLRRNAPPCIYEFCP